MRYYTFINQSKKGPQIGKLICLAQTYRKHAEEMHSKPAPQPIIFLKPASAVIHSNEAILLPPMGVCFHHEVEFGVVIGKTAKHITKATALEYVLGYTICLDITARDIQSEAKKNGLPWTIAKGFDTFAPIGPIIPKKNIPDPNSMSFSLKRNENVVQCGNTKDLLWSIEELLAYISTIMTLDPGDIILTGTPEGVGEIQRGDILEVTLDGFYVMKVYVRKKEP